MRTTKTLIASVILGVAFLVFASATVHAVVGGTNSDAWDVSVGGTVITNHSGFLGSATCGRSIFGASLGAPCFGTHANFADFRLAGSVHFIEWRTSSPVTIESFNLSAAHDAHVFPGGGQCDNNSGRRDALHRGFSRFTLKAYNGATGAFDILLYDYVVPLGNDNDEHSGENANLYDPDGLLSTFKSSLDLTDDVLTQVETNRWRAEFIQFGCPSEESGPRIVELDGFEGANNDPDCSGAAIATQNANASCQATISGSDVTGVTDPDGDSLTITVSPTLLSLGSNSVMVTANDGKGGSCSKTINVNVVDVTSPVLTLIGANPLTLECAIDSYSDPGASVTDNCDSPTVVVGGDTVDPGTVGTYVVTYNASDSAGNSATQLTRTVNVVDTTPPVISLNGSSMVTLECGVDSYVELGATASDACDPSVPVSTGGDTVDPGTPGTYFVTYDAQDDSGNMAAQATRNVVVQDTLPPVIQCNAPPTIIPPDAPISFTASAEDACDGTLIPEVIDYTCFWTNPAGKLVDKTNSCVVSFLGPTLSIDDSGGVKDTIQWTPTAMDASGNLGTETCSVLVVKPGKSKALLDPFEVEFPLESAQTVPDTGSAASGYCRGRFNASRSELELSCQHELPQALLRMNHGPAGQNGELLREIDSGDGLFPRKLDLSNSIGDLYGGRLYLTVPSERFPDGEIRGQIPAPPRILSFAQFGSGDGFSSELVLHNPSRSRKVTGYVRILDAAGEPLEMALLRGESSDAPSSIVEFEMPPLAGLTVRSVETVGLSGGSAIVVSDGPVAGLVRFTIPGLGVASVPGSQPLDEAITPVRSRKGFTTGLAIQNVAEGPITLHLSLRDADGVEVDHGAATRTLESGARLAQFLGLLFPGADLSDFSGELVIRSEGGSFSAIAMDLGRRAGELTTLPITPIEH